MFFVGVDLGQRRDHTAIVAVERVGPVSAVSSRTPEIHVRFAERVPLGTPYPRVVERVREVVQGLGSAARASSMWGMAAKCTVVVDATGVGAPVVDLMRGAGLGSMRPGMPAMPCEVVAVTISGGERERSLRSNGGRAWSVPKRDLIGGVQTLLERGELKIAAKLREREALRRELLDVETRENASGRMRIGADGAGEHDDLVIALALACWRARMRTVGEMAVGRLF
jgi:hypothetical protein